MNRIITIGLILLGFFTLQSCSSNNKDNSSKTANQAETMEVEEEYSVPQYELIPVADNDGSWFQRRALAVKQNGKFVVFDNDADYSALGHEVILYYYAYWKESSELTNDELRERGKSLAPLVQQYLRDKSSVRGHELFSIVDKAYYDNQTSIGDYFYKDVEHSRYNKHFYSNGNSGGSFKCFCDSGYYSPDGEKIPSNVLLIDRYSN